MATAVLFIGWDRPNAKHEEAAYGWLMKEGLPFLEKQKGKYFERMEPVGLTAHGGDMNGFVLLFGDRDKLDELRRTDQFEGFAMNLSRRFDKVGVVPGVNWNGMQKVLSRHPEM